MKTQKPKKTNRSISLDSKITKAIDKQAIKEVRSFSGMIEYICSQYLDNLKEN